MFNFSSRSSQFKLNYVFDIRLIFFSMEKYVFLESFENEKKNQSNKIIFEMLSQSFGQNISTYQHTVRTLS